jgi:hypothetical protein
MTACYVVFIGRKHGYKFHSGGHSGFVVGMERTNTGPFRCTISECRFIYNNILYIFEYCVYYIIHIYVKIVSA